MGFKIAPGTLGAAPATGASCEPNWGCISTRTGLEDLWSTPGVLRIEGDSAWGLKASSRGKAMGCGGASGFVSSDCGIMVAALAEKNPFPRGGNDGTSSSPLEETGGRSGEPGVDEGPFLLG